MSGRTREEIREIVLGALRKVAPEVDPAVIDPKVDWQDQLDIDSIDLLNVAIGIHEALGIDIPEEDYPRLSSLERTIDYLMSR